MLVHSRPRWFRYGCVLLALGLIVVDLLLPQDVYLALVFRVPVLWLAWYDERAFAWVLTVCIPLLHTVLRPWFGRVPYVYLHQWANLGLWVAVMGLEMELVWRARR